MANEYYTPANRTQAAPVEQRANGFGTSHLAGLLGLLELGLPGRLLIADEVDEVLALDEADLLGRPGRSARTAGLGWA